MNSKTKKLIASIATIILFIIGGIFYLTAPGNEQGNTDDSAGYVVEDDFNNQSEADELNETTTNTAESTVDEEQIDTTDTDNALNNSDEDEETQEYQDTYEFRKQQYLDEHFAKHGSEFDYENADEYLAGANRVINDPNSLYKTEAEDGDHIYYLESTNEFVVVSTDGYIRTYFRPSAGIDYFNRQ